MNEEEYTNELRPEFLSIAGLNSFAAHNSSSRAVMMASHITQHIVIDNPEEKIIQSGLEHEFAKYTFSVKMPENGKIIKIIERFPAGISNESLPFNPETYVIYEKDDTKEIDYFVVPYYNCLHQYFGYKNKETENISSIKIGNFISKDTVFANTPGVSENNSYMYGTNLNVAFMSIPAVSEDGVMISEDALQKFKYRIYETRTVSFGNNDFPLNIHGSIDEYKPFPEIGSYISETRNDGVLMMLRKYQDNFSVTNMSIYDTMEPDFYFDKATYVKGSNGRVVDIQVISNNERNRKLPNEVVVYIEKYRRALMTFYQNIINTEIKLRLENKRKYGVDTLKLTPKLHSLLVQALAAVNTPLPRDNKSLKLLHRKTPINEYMIKFVIEYEITPNIGHKLTDSHGG